MATAISAKPPAHPPKIKRPPPPFGQTGINGVRVSQPTPSPLVAPNRASGVKQTGAATPNGGVVVNGASSRLGTRSRKEPQKAADPSSRLQRISTRVTGADGVSVDRRLLKKFPEPYGWALRRLTIVEDAELLTYVIMSSQNNFVHSQEVFKVPAISGSTSPPNPLSLRSTRWKFSIQFGYEGHNRAYSGRHSAS